jgi:ubiquinone/menaquinone biosynthesis C-methylase UbiE
LPSAKSSAFTQAQRIYHREADVAHFTWQTTGPYFAQTEAALLRDIVLGKGERLLELGAGEGGNLHHLRQVGALRIGVDRSPRKAAFGRRATGAQFIVADVAALPLADASFDVILIRDLLHHLPDRLAALREARRVLRPRGRLFVIEPNARSPLALLQALILTAERGILESTARRLHDELYAAGFTVCARGVAQALPLSRVVLHPRLGWPQLAQRRWVTAGLSCIEQAAAYAVPRALWLYLTFHATPRE